VIHPASTDTLVGALSSVHTGLERAKLELTLDGVDAVRIQRDAIIAQIDDYLLPRVERLDAPLLVVIGGSTGAGKSTVTNTLVGAEVSTPGVLRPTTRSPVLVCHPDDLGWFEGDRILPGLSRTTGLNPGSTSSLRIETATTLAPGVALLDTPDIDSVEEANRNLATQLLSAADLWLFLTTAARYADAVPWDFLRQASDRSIALAVVLNRVPHEAIDEVGEHLRSMLDNAGLTDALMFAIPEGELASGRLRPEAIVELHRWLADLITDAEARAGMVIQTLEGALDSLGPRITSVTDHLDTQAAAVEELRNAVERSYRMATEQVADGLSDGTILRGEVIDRWQELVGTGDIMATIQSRVGWIRDRIKSFFTGREVLAAETQGALESNIESLLASEADKAALRTVDTWRTIAGGWSALGDQAPALERSSRDFRDLAGRAVREWQGDVLELVRAQGASKRAAARAVSLGVNTVGVALMVLVFAQTSGLTGAEVAVAGGTATVSQTLLTAIFGEQAMRSLAADARRSLIERVRQIYDDEGGRFIERLEQLDAGPVADELRAAVAELDGSRD